MTFLLDTTTFSDLLREVPRITARLVGLPGGDRAVICPIVRGEAGFGVARLPEGKRRQSLQAKMDTLLAAFPCESIPADAGDHYARIKLARQRKGLTLDENDLWIAATAMALQATLVTRDSDFERIDGLTVEDWSA